MTVSLAKTARANRLAALAYLEQQRRKDGEVVDLAALRSQRKPTPVFMSCRSMAEDTPLAA